MDSIITSLENLISENGVVILDGATGTELKERGLKLSKKLWTAKLLKKEEGIKGIKNLEKDYFFAGSDVVTTCSYQIAISNEFSGYKMNGISEKECHELLLKSVKVAKDVIQENKLKNKFVALSLSCFGASIPFELNNSAEEFVGSYIGKVKDEEIEKFHAQRMKILFENQDESSNPDILLFETYPALKEVEIICEKILKKAYSDKKLKSPVVFSFSCKDEKNTNHGDSLLDVCKSLNKYDFVYGIGVNCTKPQFCEEIIKTFKKNTKKVLFCYPNSE